MGTLRVELARRIVAGSHAIRSVVRGIDRGLESWLGVLLRRALTVDEKQALSIALYEDSFNPGNDFAGLYPWEQKWFSRRLPKPPSRLLVGAAGCGREAKALEGLGYSIVALEPTSRAAQHCKRTLARTSTVVQGSYEDLVAAAFGRSDPRFPLTSQDRFDAVILGWGSLGHVLRAEDRLRLLSACDALCPTGPILFSLFRPAESGRSERAAEASPAFFSWGGFLAEPTAEELAAHGKDLGRELIAGLDEASPYFTLLPSKAATGAHAGRGPDGAGH